MTTLTERYIATTVKDLPPATQQDVRNELEASIADAIDARIEQGDEPTTAEHTVLSDMGDPSVLAAAYADRPLHLIGPRYYLTWWRLLKLLLIIVPLCVLGAVALGQALTGAGIGTLIGQSIVAALGAIVHVCFWVTLVFFVLERTGADATLSWSPDDLAEVEPTTSRSELIASFVFLGLAAAALLWDQFRGFVFVGQGDVLPILNTTVWLILLALVVLEMAFAIVLYLRKRWSLTMALINAALAVVFVSVVLTAMGRGQLFNPEFVQTLQLHSGMDDNTMRTLGVLTVFGIIAVTIWSVIDGGLKARRDRQP